MADERLIPAGIDDDRTRRILALLDRWDTLPLERLLVYRRREAASDLLRELGWQFHVMGLEGWDMAVTAAQQRELVGRAMEIHRYRGTPYAIRRSLDAVGFGDLDIVEARTAAEQLAEAGIRVGDTTAGDLAAEWFDHWAEYGLVVRPALDAGLSRERQDLVRALSEMNAPARSQLVKLLYSYRGDSTLGFAFAGHAARVTEQSGTVRGRRRTSGTLGLATAVGMGGMATEGQGRGRQRLKTRAGLAAEVTAGRMLTRCGRAAGRHRTRAQLGQATTATVSESRTAQGTADGARRLRTVSGLATSSQTAESRTATGTADGTRRMRLDRWGAGTAAMTETVHHEQERVLPALYLHTRSEPVHAPDGTTVVTALPGGLAITQGGQTILLGGVQPSQPSFTLIGTATGQAGDDTLTFAASPDVAIGDTVVASAQWHTVIGITSNQVTLDAPLGRDVDAQILRKDS